MQGFNVGEMLEISKFGEMQVSYNSSHYFVTPKVHEKLSVIILSC